MSISNYIELGIMALIIITGVTLLIYAIRKVADVYCSCRICKKKDLKGKKYN